MSIEYYQRNAASFFKDTINVEMEELYKPFIELLPNNALILDAGCGSGRDSKAFLNKGFQVEAFDASSEMVKLAKKSTGLNVKLKRFEQVNIENYYDAIWTCASLLHVSQSELLEVLERLAKSLKVNGFWYMSFKYGRGQREKSGRTFTDMDEELFSEFIKKLNLVREVKTWITSDKRVDRNELWFNAILSRI